MRVFKSNVKIKIIGIIVVGLFVWFWFCLPSQLFDEPSSFVVEDNSGNLLSASIAADGQWRFPDEIEVPEKFIKCIT
ncbi:MAG: hypothetical protein ABI208_06940, partial [Ginsengibacter sp.]